MSRKLEAARRLLKARNAVLQAEGALCIARQDYVEAEKAYCAAVLEPAAHSTLPGDHQDKIVVDGVAILPKEEWFDLLPGGRLEFHRVEVLP